LLWLLVVSALLSWVVSANLRSSWVALPWLATMALWGYYFWSARREEKSQPAPGRFPGAQFCLLLSAAFVTRWFKISELPVGPSVDEIFTLNNTIELFHQPFDLFGHTPLFVEGWVETAKLYLYFNFLIVELFGVSYWSMKLFSVIPGIIACGALFLVARLLCGERTAFLTALLFAFAHWPVRLSRYGWDVSFQIMAFVVALGLLLLALRQGRIVYAYLCGIAAGISLYSYVGARICVLSLAAFLLWHWLEGRRQDALRRAAAFFTGVTVAAFPLLLYYLAHPDSFWLRTTELSVFNNTAPAWAIIDNIWRHALMFFTYGGAYARDNYPGLPMLDPLSGALFITGLAAMRRRFHEAAARLLASALLVNFAGGIFSVSQEGPPYVYRSAAVMVPVFLISGLGLQTIADKAQRHMTPRRFSLLAWPALLCILALNLYFYFGLEAHNRAAMRVMAYEPRLIGLEIARDDLPVFLLGRDLFGPDASRASAGEKYAAANPPTMLARELQQLAVIEFSDRYDLGRSLAQNFAAPQNIHFIESAAPRQGNLPLPAKIIFRSANHEAKDLIRSVYAGASLREIRDIDGEPFLTVATLTQSSGWPGPGELRR
jgi:hypothetical protein